MRIEFENIILRDMEQCDIENYVRWFTSEMWWMDTDAPWEKEESNEENERNSWTEYYHAVKDLPGDLLRWKFEIQADGKHIGWVSSYMVDQNYEWIGVDAIQPGQLVHRAVGIDICEPSAWGQGVGTKALQLFLNYYRDNGLEEIYTQTWSGNTRMLRCAAKLGFEECNRYPAIRQVEGKNYDALTFRLKFDKQ